METKNELYVALCEQVFGISQNDPDGDTRMEKLCLEMATEANKQGVSVSAIAEAFGEFTLRCALTNQNFRVPGAFVQAMMVGYKLGRGDR